MIAIELTSCCNHNCSFCPYRMDGKEVKRGVMDFEKFKEIFDKEKPDEVALFNRGEPFLYPEIYEAIEYAQKSAQVVISTNGVLVDPEKLYNVFKRGTLCVSCPAGNRETFQELTGCDNFETVKANIIALEALRSPTIDFYVKMVSTHQNEGQDALLREFASRVVVVENSNQSNPHGYTDCTQPDVCPTWDFTGKKKVCCRDEFGKYDWNKFYEQAKKRELPICKKCAIR